MTQVNNTQDLRRWQSILGGGEADGIGEEMETDQERAIDQTLQALYDPSPVVRVLQKDALERLY